MCWICSVEQIFLYCFFFEHASFITSKKENWISECHLKHHTFNLLLSSRALYLYWHPLVPISKSGLNSFQHSFQNLLSKSIFLWSTELDIFWNPHKSYHWFPNSLPRQQLIQGTPANLPVMTFLYRICADSPLSYAFLLFPNSRGFNHTFYLSC